MLYIRTEEEGSGGEITLHCSLLAFWLGRNAKRALN